MRKIVLISLLTACSILPTRATLFEYTAILSGPAESPPNDSLGTGTVFVNYDDVAHTLFIDAVFSGLSGTTTICHIHAPTLNPLAGTAGVATPTPTFPGFPAGVTSGTYTHTLDLTQTSSYNAPFLTASGGTAAGAEAALATAIADGKAYFNLHTSMYGGGEIRGFLVPVPEPSSAALLGLGVIGFLVGRMNRGMTLGR